MAYFDEFEVLTGIGTQVRYKRSEGYFWSWVDDTMTSVDIYLKDENEDVENVYRYLNISGIGDVTPNTCLNLNLPYKCVNCLGKDCGE